MTMNEEMEAVRKFAEDMGYNIYEKDYMTAEKPPRPAHSIEFPATENSIGECIGWAWWTDTGKRMF